MEGRVATFDPEVTQMKTRDRKRVFWWALALALLVSAVAGSWAFADRGEVEFTATLYADVIRFEADGAAGLLVVVYDLAENELWNSGVAAGGFVDWDRTNEQGERLANGYYLYLAQGWDGSGALVLNKAGKVVLLPGEQVALRSAPTVSNPSDGGAWRTDDPIFAPKAYDAANWYVSGNLGVGTDTPSRPLHVLDGSMLLEHTSDTIRQYFYSPARRWMFFASGLDGAFGIYDLDAGARRLTIGTSGNVGIGVDAPTRTLDVSGDINWSGSLYHGGSRWLHFSDTDNIYFGVNAGDGSTYQSNHNLVIGNGALRSNWAGDYNIAIGTDAMAASDQGHENVAVGYWAMKDNTTGDDNVAIGAQAMGSNESGEDNVAIGSGALNRNIGGSDNVAVGFFALFDPGPHEKNTVVGSWALNDVSGGTNNTALGYMAGGNLTSGSHNIYIGARGAASESNTIRIGSNLGDETDHTQVFFHGIHGVTVSGGTAVYIKPNGQLGTTTSSARFKTGIADLGPTSDVLYDLRPVTFAYKWEIDPLGITQYGLIAEEVAEVAPDLVIYDDAGDPYTVRYEQLVPLLLNELQEQEAEIDELQAKVAELDELRALVDRIGTRLVELESASQ